MFPKKNYQVRWVLSQNCKTEERVEGTDSDKVRKKPHLNNSMQRRIKNKMKKHFEILALIALGFTACSEKTVRIVPDELRAGQEAFNRVCGTCHGIDLMGNPAASKLIDENYYAERFSNEQIRNTIINGSQSRVMRPQRGRVSDSEIEEIIKFIRYSQKNKSPMEKLN